MGLTADGRHPQPVLPGGGDLGGRLLVGGDDEAVAGDGDVGEAEDLHRRRRAGFLDLVALVVDERTDTAPGGAGDERVADLQGAVLHEDRGDGASADVEVGLEHDAACPTLGRGPQVFELGEHEDVLEEVVDAQVLEGGDLDHDGVAAP